MTRSFDADAQTRELLDAEITIGEKKFHPAKLTPDVRRDQLHAAVDSAKLAQEGGLNEPDSAEVTTEQMDRRVDVVADIDVNLRKQLAVLLRGEDDVAPTEEFLAEHLDNRVASKLLTWLLEDQSEKVGEAPAASTNGTSG